MLIRCDNQDFQKSDELVDFETDWVEQNTLSEIMDSFERNVLRQEIDGYDSQSSAAKALEFNQSTVARKLKKLGIS